MRLKVRRSETSGKVNAPPSKSYTHRALICAAMAQGSSVISKPLVSDDTTATATLCRMLGADVNWDKHVEITGRGYLDTPGDVMYCRGSGTTLRLMTAVAANAPGISVLTGNESLRARPVGILLKALKDLGVRCYSTGMNGLPPVVVFGGGIRGGQVTMKGDVSSQYVTALLLSCPRATGETVIELSTELESRPYVDITLEVLDNFGIEIEVSESYGRFSIPPEQVFSPGDYTVPGDFSSAAFLLALGALTGDVRVSGLDFYSKQGDKMIIDIIKKMGAVVRFHGDTIEVKKRELHGLTMDMSQIPDLAPVCAVLATQARGTSRLVNAERLRIKESDRLSAITSELRKMGADIREDENSLCIRGPTELKGANIYPHDDHRIAMACTVAAMVAEGDTVIEDAECMNKSYPDFIRDMEKIGAEVKCLSP